MNYRVGCTHEQPLIHTILTPHLEMAQLRSKEGQWQMTSDFIQAWDCRTWWGCMAESGSYPDLLNLWAVNFPTCIFPLLFQKCPALSGASFLKTATSNIILPSGSTRTFPVERTWRTRGSRGGDGTRNASREQGARRGLENPFQPAGLQSKIQARGEILIRRSLKNQMIWSCFVLFSSHLHKILDTKSDRRRKRRRRKRNESHDQESCWR